LVERDLWLYVVGGRCVQDGHGGDAMTTDDDVATKMPRGQTEVQSLHEDAVEAAVSAAELDDLEDALEVAPATDDVAVEINVDEALERSHLSSEPETRFEELEPDDAALESLEPRDLAHTASDLLCSRCHLWKASSQFVDVSRRICNDCAE
jgi:hypothetical protein